MIVSDELDCLQAFQQVQVPTVDSHHLIVDIFGPKNADTVILIHGLGADSTIWSLFGYPDCLIEHDFRVISFDLRGHGRSAHLPVQHESVIQSCFSDLSQIIQYCEIKSCHLIGHSLGGVLALLAPIFCPTSNFVGLTVLSAHCFQQDLQPYRNWLDHDLASWSSWVADELGIEQSQAMHLIERHSLEVLQSYVANDQTNFSRVRDLSSIPTFLIAGSEDPEVQKIRRLSEQFNQPICILPGVGHVGVLGQLDSFKSDLLWHLQGTFGLFSDRLLRC